MATGVDDLRPYLKALVLIELEKVKAHDIDLKADLLLHRAGIGMNEIAGMLAKNYAAVAKAINRAKGGTSKEKVQRALTHADEEE